MAAQMSCTNTAPSERIVLRRGRGSYLAGLFGFLFGVLVIGLDIPHIRSGWSLLVIVAFALYCVYALRVYWPGWLRLAIDADGVTLTRGPNVTLCRWDDVLLMRRCMGSRNQEAGIFIRRRGDPPADHGCYDRSWFFIPDSFPLNRAALADLLRRYHDQGGRPPLPPEQEDSLYDAKSVRLIVLVLGGVFCAPVIMLLAVLFLRHH
ncbi:hypothetical protein [Nitrospirillum amazonense]|uniref:hypothetical protein n=1 Tax=Nitrospirillum amazonense TaxID=28077 RepID=UPI0011A164AB|nr:hypothetical protein [Nitrospirillum amazonense]